MFLTIILVTEGVVSRSVATVLFKFFFALLVAIFGWSLLRSVRKEVKQKEELSNLAESLEQANARLLEIDKQKTDFLSIASHQLRTPLSVLKGYIELVKDGAYGKVGSTVTKVLGDMNTNNEHLIKLVDDFLNITRIEQGRIKYEFGMHDICKLTDDAMRDLKFKAVRHGLEVKWACPKEKKEIYCDAEKIHHIIYNFIDNAIKYSEKGAVKVSFNQEDGGVALRVRDQGLGFKKSDGANFYQKFYRGENVKGTNVNGTGLGLYVCRKFIEGHNGRVWAKSDGLGKGSEFGFWVPLEVKEQKVV